MEQRSFTPLVFTSIGGMADENKRFHSRLAELLALKKGDDYATTISWIRAKVSFAILRSALLVLRGTRRNRRVAICLTLTLHRKVCKPEFRDRSFFMSMGGLVGFGYLPLRNCMTPPPPPSMQFFSTWPPPPSRNNFFLMTPPPPPAQPETNHTPNFNKTLMYCLYQR